MKIIDVAKLLRDHKNIPAASVAGWVRSVRSNGSICFISLSDGTDFEAVQIVVKKESVDNFEEVEGLRTGAAVMASGQVIQTPGRKQDFELAAASVDILSQASEDYPLQKKEHTPEFLREIAHLRGRAALFQAIFRIRSELSFAISEFFHENNFVQVHTPVLTANDAEGAGETFKVNAPTADFFDRPVSLTVSGQLSAESYAQAFKRVFTLGPTFRAEKSYTSRHVAEFWMLEPEVAFADLEQNMALIEATVRHLIEAVVKRCAKELAYLDGIRPGLLQRLRAVLDGSFTRMSYREAIEALKRAVDAGHRFENAAIADGMDLGTEHERYLCEQIAHGPLFVTHFPKEQKAFYMKVSNDGQAVEACDLLLPGVGEIVGGSQREDDYEKVIERCREKGVPVEEMGWYADLRKYGYFKSSGFGLGLERLLMYLTGTDNIRDVIPFARAAGAVRF